MNYFGRLAQGTGLPPPRSEVAPPVVPATPETASAADAVMIEKVVEVVAPAFPSALPAAADAPPATPSPIAPAAVAPTANDQPHATTRDATEPAPFAPTATATEAEGSLREGERIVAASAPVSPPVPERKTPPPALPPIAINASPSRSNADNPSTTGRRPPPRAMAAADAAALEVAVFVPADTTPVTSPDVTRQASTAHEQRESSVSPDLPASGPMPPVIEDIAVAARDIPISGRVRNEQDARMPRLDRAAPIERRSRVEERTRGGAVDVRIGTVTLQVHAAPPAESAPVRNGFAPHRHYLRLW
jgi:hypothetical protein